MLNIGKFIKDKLEEKGISGQWLAEQISNTRQNIYKIQARSSIDTDQLFQISKALNFDFFKLYSDVLKQGQSIEEDLDFSNIKDMKLRIEELEKEVLIREDKINDLQQIITSKDKLNKFYEEALNDCKDKLKNAS